MLLPILRFLPSLQSRFGLKVYLTVVSSFSVTMRMTTTSNRISPVSSFFFFPFVDTSDRHGEYVFSICLRPHHVPQVEIHPDDPECKEEDLYESTCIVMYLSLLSWNWFKVSRRAHCIFIERDLKVFRAFLSLPLDVDRPDMYEEMQLFTGSPVDSVFRYSW
ncbi:hypothetical protein BDP27DRAFT_1330011 [Rhodocollybia butyracea]|uniref:Uncharacterized protein n=1 Tax=Rhodocollybia butyracea TaxID=206335 RepID=A0A9P5PQK5_9AGAR|nr:hypothetical protein BDP27DRAFT_1330011 [Rhodocollybia butyracea]